MPDASDSSGWNLAPHGFERLAFDLPDTLGRDAILVGELLERCRIFLDEPAGLDDPAAAIVELREGALQAIGPVPLGFGALEKLRGLVLVIGEIRDRRDSFLVVAHLRLERDVATGKASLHFEDLFRLDAEILRDLVRFLGRQRGRPNLHAAQIEEKLALGL